MEKMLSIDTKDLFSYSKEYDMFLFFIVRLKHNDLEEKK